MFRELGQFYDGTGDALEPLELSFRDYVLAEESLDDSPLVRRSEEYWLKRLESLPPGPDLPRAVSPSSIQKPRFERRSARIEPAEWNRLKARATEAGLTPSAVLLAAYSEVLATWSKNPTFTINLTLFNRMPLHRQVMDIVGDFTSLSLIEVDYSGGSSFEGRARALQTQLWEDIDHRYYSGIRVMRELARRAGTRAATFPVVFTSALVHGASASVEFLGEQVYCISQTPQVWLDHQVMEENGALVFNWDAVEELFPAGLLDDMFAAYRELLSRLCHDDSSWRLRGPPAPAARAARGPRRGQRHRRAGARGSAPHPVRGPGRAHAQRDRRHRRRAPPHLRRAPPPGLAPGRPPPRDGRAAQPAGRDRHGEGLGADRRGPRPPDGRAPPTCRSTRRCRGPAPTPCSPRREARSR